jgi:glycosyltransferase involved in cell wall biosynthesis
MDVVHIQHEYGIYKFDERLPSLMERINKLNVKNIITFHCIRAAQVSNKGGIEEELAIKLAKLANHVIVHLPSQKEILLRCGLPPQKINVIPHGTEIINEEKASSRRRFGLPLDANILLMFGFIKPHKNLHVILDALVKIRERINNVYFFIAGTLPAGVPNEYREYADSLKKKIEEFKLEKNVIYANKFIPNEEVPFLLRAADIVLFPYYEEDRSASGSFHLAIGAKRPVIASRIPKFEELKEISDELLLLPYNVPGIVNTIIRLFEDTEFKEYVIKRTDEYRKLTSWEVVAHQHLELYKREMR